MKKIIFLLSFLIISSIFSGCSPLEQSNPTATEKLTNTPILTATNTSTATSIPTETPTSTPTITPTSTSTPNPFEAENGMILIPEGEFLMGCDPEHNGEAGCSDEELINFCGGFEQFGDNLPLHIIFLDAYYIDKYEVTNVQYAECVASGDCEESYLSKDLEDPFMANLPVVGIDYGLAEAYCSWAGKRLPSEAEWEKAARGTSPRAYPWGDQEPDSNLAAYCNPSVSTNCYNGSPSEVGSYPAGVSPYGVFDMAGNVWEWVSDYYAIDYYSWSPYQNPPGPSTSQAKRFSFLACPSCGYYEHALRGGSFASSPQCLTTSYRFIQVQGPYEQFGFRCAADYE